MVVIYSKGVMGKMANIIQGQLSLFDGMDGDQRSFKETLGPDRYYAFIRGLKNRVSELTACADEIDEEQEAIKYLKCLHEGYREEFGLELKTTYQFLTPSSLSQFHEEYKKEKSNTQFVKVYQDLRNNKGFKVDVTDTEIARRAGIAKETFSRYLHGTRKPKKEHMISLCFVLHLNVDEAEEFLATQGYVFYSETECLCKLLLSEKNHSFSIIDVNNIMDDYKKENPESTVEYLSPPY